MELDKLYNEDCLSYMKTLPDECVDLVVTDCPYRIAKGGHTKLKRPDEASGILNHCNSFTGEAVKKGKLFKYNDIEFHKWLPDLFRVIKPNCHTYIMINGRNLKDLWVECESVGFNFQQFLVWDKGNAVLNKFYMNCCEFILMPRKGGARNINNMGSKNILKVANIRGHKNHPTEKPVELMEILIGNSSNKGDLIFDPFVGSGSTLLAGKKLGRHYIGCEIDKGYYEVAIARLNEVQLKSSEDTRNIRLW